MSFFSQLREAFRDDTRDVVCAHLQSLGIDAQMAPRGRAEENTRAVGFTHRSLGVLDISEGPIRWVNVTRETWTKGEDSDPSYYLVCGVPDPRVGPGFPKVRMIAGILEKFTGVRWVSAENTGKVKDLGLGIVQHLSQHVLVPRAFLESLRVGSFEILASPDRSCWILTGEDVLALSKQEWDYYQSIASHVLGTPLPPNT